MLFAALRAGKTQVKTLHVVYPAMDNFNVDSNTSPFSELNEFLIQQDSLEDLELYQCSVPIPYLLDCIQKNRSTLRRLRLDVSMDSGSTYMSAATSNSPTDLAIILQCPSLIMFSTRLSLDDLNVVSAFPHKYSLTDLVQSQVEWLLRWADGKNYGN